MSAELLLALQEAHAFDPFPVRDDLGIYHVPFRELAGDDHIEETLGDGCRRYERIAIVGDSGTGKSSLTASVLGPLAVGVAPVVVPVAIEPNETVSEPRAMFAHIAAVIARVAADAASLSATEREQALARLTFSPSWLGSMVDQRLAAPRRAPDCESQATRLGEKSPATYRALYTASKPTAYPEYCEGHPKTPLIMCPPC